MKTCIIQYDIYKALMKITISVYLASLHIMVVLFSHEQNAGATFSLLINCVSYWIILYLLRLSSDLKATEEVMFLALRFVGLIKTGPINMRRHI
jgi:hypothetical protein